MGMGFQPVKCNMMQLIRKHSNKIQASYTLEGTVLENVDNMKYHVTITFDYITRSLKCHFFVSRNQEASHTFLLMNTTCITALKIIQINLFSMFGRIRNMPFALDITVSVSRNHFSIIMI